MSHLDGRVAVVTGAGRGLGRAEALALAEEGAIVVVNDLGTSMTGEGADAGPAHEVVDLIRSRGGEAVANTDDVADWTGGQRLIDQALERYGRLDILVNNAGFLRDRMSWNLTEDDWDSVIRVHLKGHFVPTRFAVAHWREVVRRTGEPVPAVVVNTTSESGLYGYATHVNYATAKAGIAAMTISLAREVERFGVRVNAIAPVAHTRITEKLVDLGLMSTVDETRYAPENAAAMVCWLASDLSAGVTGQVFKVRGGVANVVRGWRPLPEVTTTRQPWTVAGIEEQHAALLAHDPEGLPPSYGPD